LLGRVAGVERLAGQAVTSQEIARLCGYLPLAVRIAGAKLRLKRHWSPAMLAERWTPTGFVDTIRSGTMVYEERTGSGTGSQEVHPGI
jgi:hypothetical protein